MSIRERTREVRAKGAAMRGVRDPQLDSWSYNRYLWWLKETGGDVPEQLDFCTYWRIVLLWVTGRKLSQAVARVKKPLIWLAAILGAALVAYAIGQFWQSRNGFWHEAGGAALVLILLALACAGAVAAILVTAPLIPDKTALAAGPYPRNEKLILTAIAVGTFPVFLGVSAIMLVAAGCAWLHDKRVTSKTLIWLLTAPARGVKWVSWFRPIYVLAAALIGLSFKYHWAWKLLNTVLFLGTIVSVAIVCAYLSDKHKQKRTSDKLQQELVEDDVLPDYAAPMYYVPPRQSWLKRRRQAITFRLWKAWDVVTDCLALVWTIIVTTKWRTCPIMTMPASLQERSVRNSGTVQE